MKIIFFDIDGTLICGGSELMSESTKEAIRIARANGHICMINTGRTKRLVGENLTGQVEFDGLLLGCGTEIEYHGKQLMHKTFSMEESKAILTAMKKYHVDAVCSRLFNNMFINTITILNALRYYIINFRSYPAQPLIKDAGRTHTVNIIISHDPDPGAASYLFL